jgi:hypothetical protein
MGDGATTSFDIQETEKRDDQRLHALHDTNTAPAASADILSGVQKAWGFVPNRVLAESPVFKQRG